MIDPRRLLVLAAAGVALSGCQSEAGATRPVEGVCDPAAAEALVGQERISDDRAKELTGATLVRQIKPGDMVTMDFQQARVTIETDPATGRIIRASCG
ncbi:MAG: hypothetical protein K5872_07890 [Rhizobiaceae bacterium]|nr:hypothetical protein [Rhizobiaceae bacterium]MCV0406134.1 hypothetical protein [Rhizobiaceae bacterium]